MIDIKYHGSQAFAKKKIIQFHTTTIIGRNHLLTQSGGLHLGALIEDFLEIFGTLTQMNKILKNKNLLF